MADFLEVFVASKQGFARSLGKRGKAFVDRVEETYEKALRRALDRRSTIATSGRYTPDGQRKELSALYRPMLDEFKTERAKLADNLNGAIGSLRTDARAITTETSDPNQQIVRMHRMQRLDAHLRSVDRLGLEVKMRLALEAPTSIASALLADTLREAEIIGLPIVEREAMSNFLKDLQERATPEIAEIASYRDALDAMAEQAITEVRRLAEEDRVDLARDVVTSA